MHERRWIRFPSSVPSVVVSDSQAGHHVGEVLDESFTGLAVRVDSLQGLAANQNVHVDYRGLPVPALVRYVQPTTDGGYRIGIEWEDPNGHQSHA